MVRCTKNRQIEGRGSFPASSEAGNSSRVVGLLREFTKGVK